MSGWFSEQVVQTGRLPLFCFFVAFISGFAGIRVSVRMIRAGVRWWPGNLVAGAVHVHHMVFGVVLMAAGGIAGLAAPPFSLAWRATAAGVFGLGTALVLDEFALILHLRDVYWANEGRLSVDAVFVATGITALLLIGVTPVGVANVANYHHMPGSPAAAATLMATLGRLVRPGRGHAAEGQAMDRPARSRHSADADRGCHPAGKAGFGVGQVALRESDRQARDCKSPRGAAAAAGDPDKGPRSGPADRQPRPARGEALPAVPRSRDQHPPRLGRIELQPSRPANRLLTIRAVSSAAASHTARLRISTSA